MPIHRPIHSPILRPVYPPIAGGGLPWEGVPDGGGPPAPRTILGSALTQLLDERQQSGASWIDQSGVGNTLAQATGSLRPAAGTAINGYPTLLFDGVDDAMAGPTIPNIISATRFGGWIVARTKTIGAPGAQVYTDRQFFGDAGGVVGLSCTTIPRLWCYDGGYKMNGSSLSLASDTLYAFHFYKGAAGLVLDVSGQTATTPVAAGTIAPFTGAFWEGVTFGSAYGAFEIAFQCFINREPTAAEQTQMSAFLLAKYGIAP